MNCIFSKQNLLEILNITVTLYVCNHTVDHSSKSSHPSFVFVRRVVGKCLFTFFEVTKVKKHGNNSHFIWICSQHIRWHVLIVTPSVLKLTFKTNYYTYLQLQIFTYHKRNYRYTDYYWTFSFASLCNDLFNFSKNIVFRREF